MEIAKKIGKLTPPYYYGAYPTIDKWLWDECYPIEFSNSYVINWPFFWLTINTL